MPRTPAQKNKMIEPEKRFLKQCLMMALVFTFSLSFPSYANECNDGDLMLEYTPVATFAPEPFYTARLSGKIDLPNPNYTYKLKISTKEGVQTSGSLGLHIKNPDMMSAQVITPLTIDDTIKIPHGSKALMIDVVKPFNWGAEYFRADYPDGLENAKPICMKADVYK
ncbi:MAG: hypothetical protein ACRBDI_01780 [Alphaproteobacteria bacterium]